jgi:hypothetical protein
MMWRVERTESYPEKPGDGPAVWKILYRGEDEARARETFAACYGVMWCPTHLILFKGDEPVHKVFFRSRIIDSENYRVEVTDDED